MLDVVHDVIAATGATRFEHQLPDEWRLDDLLRTGTADWGVEVVPCDTHHFLTQRDDLATHFKGKKQYLMESFYRMMRKRHAVLLDGAGQQKESGTTTPTTGRSCPRAMCRLSPSFGPVT